MFERLARARSIALICSGLGSWGVGATADDRVRLDQVQVIGTHNSYHIAPAPAVLGLVGARGQGFDYTHRPLAEQFSGLGIRQVELDVFADPEGGRYAEPAARKILRALGRDPGPDPDQEGRLRKPGFKVLHVPDIDYRLTVPTLAEALRQVRDWSEGHPGHVPILVLIEAKGEPIPAIPTRPWPFGRAELDDLDQEIRSAFPPAGLLTPDDVRGDRATLAEAVRGRGWPALDAVRGRVFFALDDEGKQRDLYLEGHPALRGRSMFVSVGPDHPAAAWMKVNDPVRDFDRIGELVRAGFLVRTRADADTIEARANDPTRLDRALASGAQFVSTDYPEPRPGLSPYRVRLPGGVVARPNPVVGPTSPPGGDLEPIPGRRD